jgi:endonuclease/exonuclease/phosphatase family metal-dependent hydrolase
VEKRDARESFYTTDIPLLPVTRSTVILAGDFNCVLTQADATGRKNFSRALDTLVRGLGLTDAWDHTTTRPIFTHYTPMGASRIDRIYISETTKSKKTGLETRSAVKCDSGASPDDN